MLPELVRRDLALKATKTRYQGKRFDWSRGVTCVHLARTHLKHMGHKPPALPRFRSALAAKKALKERGWDSVTAMLDSLLPRIPPAAMLPGDLAVVPGEGMEAIHVCLALGRHMGWHPAQDEPPPSGAEQMRALDEMLYADEGDAWQRADEYIRAVNHVTATRGLLAEIGVSLDEISAAWRA